MLLLFIEYESNQYHGGMEERSGDYELVSSSPGVYFSNLSISQITVEILLSYVIISKYLQHQTVH